MLSGEITVNERRDIYQQLADIWMTCDTEDPMRSTICCGLSLCLGNRHSEGIPMLISAAEKAFLRREYQLAEYAVNACYLASRDIDDLVHREKSWVLGLRIARKSNALSMMDDWLNRKPIRETPNCFGGVNHEIWLNYNITRRQNPHHSCRV